MSKTPAFLITGTNLSDKPFFRKILKIFPKNAFIFSNFMLKYRLSSSIRKYISKRFSVFGYSKMGNSFCDLTQQYVY